MRIILLIAFRNLIQARRRTILLTVALSIVTMLLVILLSLSQGLTETMMRNATTLLSGHVNVAGFMKAKSSDAYPIITRVSELKKIVKENTPDLDYITDRVRGWGKVVSEKASIQTALHGIDLKEEKNFLKVIRMAEEREYKDGGKAQIFGDPQKLLEPGYALCFAAQAKRLEIGVGDSITLTVEIPGGRVNATQVTIAAIAKDLGFSSNWNFFIPKDTLYELYDLDENTSGAIMVYLKDINRANEVLSHLQNLLKEKGFTLMDYNPQPLFMKFESVMGEDWIGEKLDLTLWEDEISFLKWIITAFDTISIFLVGTLTVIICIGIMNTMWISVRERTNEIGTMRAIGMYRGRVLILFLSEAILLGFGATLIGTLLGSGIAYLVNSASFQVHSDAVKALLMSDTLHLSVKLSHIISAILIFTIVTSLAALWPATKASRMEPVKAIQYVG